MDPNKTEEKEKRLTLSRETRIIKAIGKIFPEPREQIEPAALMRAIAKGDKLTILDREQIRCISPKNADALRILSRFYQTSAESRNPINLVEQLKREGPAKYDVALLTECLKIFSAFKDINDPAADVIITQGHNAPIKLENDYFIVYLAPRIDDKDQQNTQ